MRRAACSLFALAALTLTAASCASRSADDAGADARVPADTAAQPDAGAPPADAGPEGSLGDAGWSDVVTTCRDAAATPVDAGCAANALAFRFSFAPGDDSAACVALSDGIVEQYHLIVSGATLGPCEFEGVIATTSDAAMWARLDTPTDVFLGGGCGVFHLTLAGTSICSSANGTCLEGDCGFEVTASSPGEIATATLLGSCELQPSTVAPSASGPYVISAMTLKGVLTNRTMFYGGDGSDAEMQGSYCSR